MLLFSGLSDCKSLHSKKNKNHKSFLLVLQIRKKDKNNEVQNVAGLTKHIGIWTPVYKNDNRKDLQR